MNLSSAKQDNVNMCGIAGFLLPSGPSQDDLAAWATTMSDTLAHRGPDASGVWTDARDGIALAHRRLSILDLSPSGAQPMASACGRYITAYNGEIYNHLELRTELQSLGHAFQGGSDTETLLAAVVEWGLEGAVKRFVGMFAIAIWDRHKQTLSLVRDRLGIKPLYYGHAGDTFLFASELKPFKTCPAFTATIDRNALALYFRHNYIPAPHTIYEKTNKLEPGCILTLSSATATPKITTYWSAHEAWANGATHPFQGSIEDATDELEQILSLAVQQRLISDVPLGAFLSGGIDSSTIVALMQAQSDTPVRTFSIGFKEAKFNETKYAKAVANHLGTNHTELYVTPQDLLACVQHLPRHWDEPFADSSQIPTLCISHMARKHVTVVLSGDGGDELFAGYTRYVWGDLWKRISCFPLPLRRTLAHAGKLIPEPFWNLLGPKGTKIRWRLDGLGSENFSTFYRFLLSHHKTPASFVLGATEPRTKFDSPFPRGDGYINTMRYLDTVSYLPDDILTKVDRASMAASLEARVPLLDHRIVEFAATLPQTLLTDGITGKLPLRRLLTRHVPNDLINRPKMGFGVPIEHWLAKELRDWCEALLDENILHAQGFLAVKEVRRMWSEFLSGQINWHYYLWDILMFQAWLAEQR